MNIKRLSRNKRTNKKKEKSGRLKKILKVAIGAGIFGGILYYVSKEEKKFKKYQAEAKKYKEILKNGDLRAKDNLERVQKNAKKAEDELINQRIAEERRQRESAEEAEAQLAHVRDAVRVREAARVQEEASAARARAARAARDARARALAARAPAAPAAGPRAARNLNNDIAFADPIVDQERINQHTNTLTSLGLNIDDKYGRNNTDIDPVIIEALRINLNGRAIPELIGIVRGPESGLNDREKENFVRHLEFLRDQILPFLQPVPVEEEIAQEIAQVETENTADVWGEQALETFMNEIELTEQQRNMIRITGANVLFKNTLTLGPLSNLCITCMDLVENPISGMCGHTFHPDCLPSLQMAEPRVLDRVDRVCPCCRSPWYLYTGNLVRPNLMDYAAAVAIQPEANDPSTRTIIMANNPVENFKIEQLFAIRSLDYTLIMKLIGIELISSYNILDQRSIIYTPVNNLGAGIGYDRICNEFISFFRFQNNILNTNRSLNYICPVCNIRLNYSNPPNITGICGHTYHSQCFNRLEELEVSDNISMHFPGVQSCKMCKVCKIFMLPGIVDHLIFTIPSGKDNVPRTPIGPNFTEGNFIRLRTNTVKKCQFCKLQISIGEGYCAHVRCVNCQHQMNWEFIQPLDQGRTFGRRKRRLSKKRKMSRKLSRRKQKNEKEKSQKARRKSKKIN